MPKKKKILFQSDFSLIKTGFARNAKALLSYLYKTGKYEIVHYCCGMDEECSDLNRTPWRSIGCLPHSKEKQQLINRDPFLSKNAAYGSFKLDEIIYQEKPDVYIAAQDIWGVDFAIKKPWFKKITSAIWTTLDSLPILPTAVDAAKIVENYWVWSSFAADELNKMGYGQVKTMHGVFDDEDFFRLSDEKRLSLRKENDIEEDCFIIGFVFRNQLRKSVPNLFQGYRLFRERNPHVRNAKLLLHTDFREGWDIKRLAAEIKIDGKDILTTYICSKCFKYSIKSYEGVNQPCRHCGSAESTNTASVSLGTTEEQLNEIYNFMDVYCHPFTSGGQEIPIQEAKSTELITLVTNYSCGVEMSSELTGSLPLDWTEYREFGTQFIKASTRPESIAKQLRKVFNMKREKKRGVEKKSKDWVNKNYSIKNIGPKIEKFMDDAPFATENCFSKPEKKDPSATIPENKDDKAWVKSLYKEILKTDLSEGDAGLEHWMNEIKKGGKRETIEDYFRRVAYREKEQKKDEHIENFLDENDERILFVLPEIEHNIYMSTSLFKSIKEMYPRHNLYVACKKELFNMLAFNPHVHKLIPYSEEMSNPTDLEGEDDKGLFDIVYAPHLNSKNYIHNNKDKISFNLKY
jgi:glycosyltransferase involved in cell wall biosynthesis